MPIPLSDLEDAARATPPQTYGFNAAEMLAEAANGDPELFARAQQLQAEGFHAQDYEAISRWMNLQSDIVKTHSQIVDGQIVGQAYMLHIDKNTPEVFTPMMPRSAAPSEDNTAARITVAPTLIGCYIGYQRAHDDLIKGSKPDPEKGDPFRGGYEICTLEFMHCLKVSNKLVSDASRSQEHWLVAYTPETREYKPTKVGKVFVSKMEHVPVSGQHPSTSLTFYIEVTRDQGFKFSPKMHLDKGYHKVEVLWQGGKLANCYDESAFVLGAITQEEYDTAKRLCAALLERKEVPKGQPYFNLW